MGILMEALDLLRDEDAIGGPEGVCPTLIEPGHDRFMLVTGENAGGKTFLAHLLAAWSKDLEKERENKLLVMDVSMRRRSTGGMERAFMFGDEDWETTGQISVKAVLGGLRTCRERDVPHMLLLDEPDIGLGESYQAAMGDRFVEFVEDLPEMTKGFIVVTHSRPMVQQLMRLGPTCLRVGDDLRPTAEWLKDGSLPRTASDLEGLQERAIKRFRAITELRKVRQADREAAGPKR